MRMNPFAGVCCMEAAFRILSQEKTTTPTRTPILGRDFQNCGEELVPDDTMPHALDEAAAAALSSGESVKELRYQAA